jgi:hypothetical protein
VNVTLRSRSSGNGSKPHFTAEKRVEAPFYGRETGPVLRVKRNRTETFHNVRDCPRLHRPVFATVAWPSEAVRERDVTITFIRKRVEAPFYGRETGRSPILRPRNGSKPHFTAEKRVEAPFYGPRGPLAMISDRH